MAIALGLARREGRKLYEDEKRARNELAEWEARKPLRDALAAAQIQEAEEYIADKGNRALLRRAETQKAREFMSPEATGLRKAETQNAMTEQQKRKVKLRNLSIVDQHSADIMNGPSGFVEALNKIQGISGKGGWRISPDDKDGGYKNGLMLELVDADGRVVQKQNFSNVANGKTALREFEAYISDPQTMINTQRAADAAELKYQRELYEKKLGWAHDEQMKRWDLMLKHTMNDSEMREVLSDAASKGLGLIADKNGNYRVWQEGVSDIESLPFASPTQIQDVENAVNKATVDISNSGDRKNVVARMVSSMAKQRKTEAAQKMSPQETQTRTSGEFGVSVSPEFAGELARRQTAMGQRAQMYPFSSSVDLGLSPEDVGIQAIKEQAEKQVGLTR